MLFVSLDYPIFTFPTFFLTTTTKYQNGPLRRFCFTTRGNWEFLSFIWHLSCHVSHKIPCHLTVTVCSSKRANFIFQPKFQHLYKDFSRRSYQPMHWEYKGMGALTQTEAFDADCIESFRVSDLDHTTFSVLIFRRRLLEKSRTTRAAIESCPRAYSYRL